VVVLVTGTDAQSDHRCLIFNAGLPSAHTGAGNGVPEAVPPGKWHPPQNSTMRIPRLLIVIITSPNPRILAAAILLAINKHTHQRHVLSSGWMLMTQVPEEGSEGAPQGDRWKAAEAHVLDMFRDVYRFTW
jgi:hypothetical protein